MPLDVVQTLCDLVRTPSVNPMGREYHGDEFLEHAMTDHLEEVFRQLELPIHRQEIEPRRENIVARLEGASGSSILVFEAHQDTVPVDGMTIAPWTPEVTGGRVTGRGSCDIKGGMASMLTTVSRLAGVPREQRPTIIMACTVNEEHGYFGAFEMADSWRNGTHPLVPRVPDAVIVAEPTELNVVVAHKGVARWRCHALGRAAHSSCPDAGENAIYRMARILAQLEIYAHDVVPQLGTHPYAGQPTLSVGIISGGVSVNTVPDRCTIEIDRRVLPNEDPVTARQHVIEYLTSQLGANFSLEHDPPFISKGGLDADGNGALAEKLSAVAQQLGAPGQKIGVPFGTDAPAFAATGAPTVVFGPGSIDQAHTCDEWVAIDQLQEAVEILFEFVQQSE
jgi:acetylornithine deacetylase